MLGIEIVDDDEIEIGRRRHLAAAELAERKQRGLLAADAAVVFGDRLLDPPVQRADRDVGEPREGAARLLGRDRARQDARADQEHLLLAEQAQPVEKILVGCAPRSMRARQARPRAWPRPAARRRTSARSARPSPRDSAPGYRRAAARCRASARAAPPGPGSAAAARTGARRACKPPRNRSKALSAASGFSARARWSSSTGTSSVNWRAGELAAQRRIVAGQPAPHRCRHLQRLPEAHGAEPVERLAVVGVLRGRTSAS